MKIVTVLGARPQFIKAVSVTRAIKNYRNSVDKNSRGKRRHIQEIILHTGQHYDYNMSDKFFEELCLPRPKYNLGIALQTHGAQTGQMLIGIEKVLLDERPDLVLVYGDTNSTLAGALAAAKLNMPVAHVEAGLRSFNRQMPEEKNRVIVDHLSDYLFCPTEKAVKNLKKEGITQGVYNVGDVMYDLLLYSLSLLEKRSQYTLEKVFLRLRGHAKLELNPMPKSYYLATVHRAENTDNLTRLSEIFCMFEKLDLSVLVPIHPRTNKALSSIGIKISNAVLIEPVSYFDMIILQKNAKAVFTDSGGIQKEAYFLNTPCVTLRDETEWPETVESGWNKVVGVDSNLAIEAVRNLKKESFRSNQAKCRNYFGSGNAGQRIIEILLGLR